MSLQSAALNAGSLLSPHPRHEPLGHIALLGHAGTPRSFSALCAGPTMMLTIPVGPARVGVGMMQPDGRPCFIRDERLALNDLIHSSPTSYPRHRADYHGTSMLIGMADSSDRNAALARPRFSPQASHEAAPPCLNAAIGVPPFSLDPNHQTAMISAPCLSVAWAARARCLSFEPLGLSRDRISRCSFYPE
jgi:hypothetical protein